MAKLNFKLSSEKLNPGGSGSSQLQAPMVSGLSGGGALQAPQIRAREQAAATLPPPQRGSVPVIDAQVMQHGMDVMQQAALRYQDRRDTLYAEDAFTRTKFASDDVLYAMPKEGDKRMPGYTQLSGKDALDTREAYQSQWNKVFEDHAAGLNPNARKKYLASVAEYREKGLNKIASHAVQQQEHFANQQAYAVGKEFQQKFIQDPQAAMADGDLHRRVRSLIPDQAKADALISQNFKWAADWILSSDKENGSKTLDAFFSQYDQVIPPDAKAYARDKFLVASRAEEEVREANAEKNAELFKRQELLATGQRVSKSVAAGDYQGAFKHLSRIDDLSPPGTAWTTIQSQKEDAVKQSIIYRVRSGNLSPEMAFAEFEDAYRKEEAAGGEVDMWMLNTAQQTAIDLNKTREVNQKETQDLALNNSLATGRLRIDPSTESYWTFIKDPETGEERPATQEEFMAMNPGIDPNLAMKLIEKQAGNLAKAEGVHLYQELKEKEATAARELKLFDEKNRRELALSAQLDKEARQKETEAEKFLRNVEQKDKEEKERWARQDAKTVETRAHQEKLLLEKREYAAAQKAIADEAKRVETIRKEGLKKQAALDKQQQDLAELQERRAYTAKLLEESRALKVGDKLEGREYREGIVAKQQEISRLSKELAAQEREEKERVRQLEAARKEKKSDDEKLQKEETRLAERQEGLALRAQNIERTQGNIDRAFEESTRRYEQTAEYRQSRAAVTDANTLYERERQAANEIYRRSETLRKEYNRERGSLVGQRDRYTLQLKKTAIKAAQGRNYSAINSRAMLGQLRDSQYLAIREMQLGETPPFTDPQFQTITANYITGKKVEKIDPIADVTKRKIIADARSGKFDPGRVTELSRKPMSYDEALSDPVTGPVLEAALSYVTARTSGDKKVLWKDAYDEFLDAQKSGEAGVAGWKLFSPGTWVDQAPTYSGDLSEGLIRLLPEGIAIGPELPQDVLVSVADDPTVDLLREINTRLSDLEGGAPAAEEQAGIDTFRAGLTPDRQAIFDDLSMERKLAVIRNAQAAGR